MTATGIVLFLLGLFLLSLDSQRAQSMGFPLFAVGSLMAVSGVIAFVWRVFP